MAVINILAFAVLTLLLSFKWKERIVDVLPLSACILILVLYVLAFFRRLSAIDWIGGAFLLAVLGYLGVYCREAGQRKQLWAQIKRELSHPGTLTALLVFAGTTCLVSGRIATWWDDVNFWATDVKAIFALDGFAAKYTNAAPEFGDYPPGVQLMKWWFVHMRTERFSEGLMFAGYYFCVFVFLMPLLRRMKGKNPLFVILTAVCLWAFPSVAEAFYCQGMCADLVMAVIYGAFLSAVLDEEGHAKSFYHVRLALYLSVLVLVKSVGFLWAAFGLVFLWIWKGKKLRMQKGAAGRGTAAKERAGWFSLLAVTAAPAVTGGSWLIFCLLMRRVAKLTGSALSIAAGKLPVLLPGTREKLVRAFLEAFAVWPLHRGRTWAVDLSPLAMFFLICALIFIFGRCRILSRAEAKLLGIFLPVSGMIFYGINLVSHLTIFAAETQYLEPFAMVSSIERYGVPFTVGSLYLLAFLLLERTETVGSALLHDKKTYAPSDKMPRRIFFQWREKVKELWLRHGVYLVCFAFVILSANWQEVFHGLYGYRADREEELGARAEMITEESAEFLSLLSGLDVGEGMRVLYLKDAAVSQWVKNTYVAFEASPVSLIFGSVDCETMNSGDMWNAMDASHAGYLYLDEIPGDAETLFSPFTEKISAHTLYRIQNENGQIVLEEAIAETEKAGSVSQGIEQAGAVGENEAGSEQTGAAVADGAEPEQTGAAVADGAEPERAGAAGADEAELEQLWQHKRRLTAGCLPDAKSPKREENPFCTVFFSHKM